jgi:hypothetical protein
MKKITQEGSKTFENNLLSPFSAMQFLHGGLFFKGIFLFFFIWRMKNLFFFVS